MASTCIWQQHAVIFRRLYLEENKTLKEVKLEVEAKHDFPKNNLSTYEAKLRDVLGLRKNLSPEGWVAIGQHIRARKSPNWMVHINGRTVAKNKVMREVGRYTKRRSYPSNLPVPPGVEIKWLDKSPRPAAMSARDLHPQQTVLSGPAIWALDVPRDAGFDMMCYESIPSPRRSKEVLQEPQLLGHNNLADVIPRFDTEVARNEVVSTHLSTALPDAQQTDWGNAILKDDSILSHNHTMEQTLFDKISLSYLSSLLPNPQNLCLQYLSTWESGRPPAQADPHEVLRHSRAAKNLDYTQALPAPGPISTNFDTFYILDRLVHYLCNDFDETDQKRRRDTIIFLMNQVPPNIVGEFLLARSLAIEESWMPLAEWSFELDQKHFFEQVMQVSLDCRRWVERHGASCLVFAAYFGCAKVVRNIISHGVSPNQLSTFKIPRSEISSTPGFSKLAVNEWHKHINPKSGLHEGYTVTTSPLLEAAARSNLKILEILKDAKVDVQLRLGGLTAAGHALIAHEGGAIDTDELSSTLSLLLAMGEDVDAPLWQSDLELGINYWTKRDIRWSEETLLDAVYLKNHSGALFQKMKRQSQVPIGVLTIYGILLSATDGYDALRDYLATSRYPRGNQRKRFEEIALTRSLELPRAFESMTKMGFPMEIKTLLGRENIGAYSLLPLPDQDDHYVEGYLARYIELLPVPVAQYFLDQTTGDQIVKRISKRKEFSIEAFAPLLRLNLLDGLGVALLNTCCERGDANTARQYLEAGVSPQAIDLLHFAHIGTADEDIVELLYEYGARPTSFPPSLERDPRRFSTTMLQWLITHGLVLDGMSVHDIILWVHPSADERENVRAFGQWLIGRGHPLYTRPLALCGFEKYEYDEIRPSLALLICIGSSTELISQLLDQGCDLNSRNPLRQEAFRESEPSSYFNHDLYDGLGVWYNDLPLEAAVRNGDISLVQLLLQHGANVNSPPEKSQTALEISVQSYVQAFRSSEKSLWKQLVVLLLEKGADPNRKDDVSIERLSPPLAYAVECATPDLQLLQLLLENGANVNTRWPFHGLPLLSHMFSSQIIELQHKKAILTLFLDYGARYDSTNELFRACSSWNVPLARFHLENGANPNGSHGGKSLLAVCVEERNFPMALLLLVGGATLSERRLLSTAVRGGRLDMVALLLLHEKRRKEVERALKFALEGRSDSITQLLQQHLATAN